MSQNLLECHNRPAHCDPLLCKRVAVAMDARLVQPSGMAVIPQCCVVRALCHLLSIDGAKQPIFRTSAAIFQIFMQDFYDVLIQRDNQRFTVLRGIDVNHIVIKVQILDLDVDKAVLSDSC